MATIFIDGFDKYGPISANSPSITTLFGQEYTTITGAGQITIVAPLSNVGQAVRCAAGETALNKTLSANYSRIIGGFRFSADLSGVRSSGIKFTDGGTAQVAISINVGTGTLTVRSGDINGGGALSTSSASVAASTTHYVEWDFTIAASGAYQVWLDGVSIISGTGNTRSGTGVSQVNGFSIGSTNTGGNGSENIIVDDFYLFDSTGSFCNAVLLTSPRIETRYPSGDSQTQWTNAGNVLVPVGITPTGVSNVTGSTNAAGANQLVLLKVTPSVSCTLQSVGILPAATNVVPNFKSVLYTDSAGSPNTLVATGTQVTGTTSGTALTLPFSVGQSLTGGTSYWIGYITDTSIALSQYDNTTNKGQRAANTYASGAPGTAPSMIPAQPTWELWGNATGATTNWGSVAINPAAGTGPAVDNASITSSTVSNEDLYSFPALSATTTTVYTVAVKANVKKSDVGARTIDLRLKSSATDSAGSNAGQAPGTTYGWLDSYFDTDPNGSIAWTTTTANAATAGPKVAS